VTAGHSIIKPKSCKVLHHEVELAVVLKGRGKKIPLNDASSYIAGYALALDMTARDIQDKAVKNGLPWCEGKGYDTFCAVGKFIEKTQIQDHDNVELWLKVNGQIRQQGNTSNMIFKIPSLISYLSNIMTLEDGDVILTGTPAGVGPVDVGDVITAGIVGLDSDIRFDIAAE